LDLLIASFSIGLGAIASFVFDLTRTKAKVKRKKNKNKKNQKDENYFDANKNNSDFQMMKNELDSLEIERTIISSSIRKIHETFREGKLNKLEFDRLMIKYSDDLRKCDEEIEETRSVVDLYELSSVKNNLVSIIENKIKLIDNRLNEISNKNIKMLTKQPTYVTGSQSYEQSSLNRGNLDNSLSIEAEKIKKLESEITEALKKLDNYESTKLSQAGKNEMLENDRPISGRLNGSNKKDPLRNLKLSN